jgi:hypothetical protein
MALFLERGREQFRAWREPDASARWPDYRGYGLREEQIDARAKEDGPTLRFRAPLGDNRPERRSFAIAALAQTAALARQGVLLWMLSAMEWQ